jgi:hypothetical protein
MCDWTVPEVDREAATSGLRPKSAIDPSLGPVCSHHMQRLRTLTIRTGFPSHITTTQTRTYRRPPSVPTLRISSATTSTMPLPSERPHLEYVRDDRQAPLSSPRAKQLMISSTHPLRNPPARRQPTAHRPRAYSRLRSAARRTSSPTFTRRARLHQVVPRRSPSARPVRAASPSVTAC